MPVTTYFTSEPEKHTNENINSLVAELSDKTGERWCCHELITDWRRKYIFFGPREEVRYTQLLKHVGAYEYQIIMCVTTTGEAFAFLYGALGMIKE